MATATIWTVITAVIGVISTVVAWYFNPSRQRNAELDKIFHELDELYKRRDIALDENNTDSLTAIVARINELRTRKNDILQRK